MNGLRRGARRPTPVGDRMRARSWPTIAVAQSLAGVAACSPHHDRASIEVDRPVALADAPVHLRVGGLAAGEEVTISAQAHDAGGKVWRSQAQFTAGHGGVVDLDRDRPTSGTYQGIDGMGLFWSMNPPDGDPAQAIYVPPEAGSFTVDLAVAAGGRQLATRTLTRQRRRDGDTVRALRTDTDQVAGLLALPPAGPHHRSPCWPSAARTAASAWRRWRAARLPRPSHARAGLLPLPRPARPAPGHPAGILRDRRAAPGRRVRPAAWPCRRPGLLARHRGGDAARLVAAGATLVHPVSGQLLALGGTRPADAAARRDGWPKVLAFLGRL